MPQAAKWETGKIDDLAEKVGIGPFGSSIRVNTFVPDGIPIISGQHLHGVRIDEAPGFNFITQDHAHRLANAKVERGDVVFTYAGNIGQVSYIPADSQFEQYVISQRQFYMRCDRSKVIPEYVALYFKSPEGQHKLLANSSQVGVPMIAQPVTYLRSIEIPIPPLPEQQAIAHILGTLDDKIELTRRMNRALEQIARAIFHDWFVDFGPTKAKMERQEPYLPPELWDLFPDQLVDSELGEIPDGWQVKPLGKTVELFGGTTPNTKTPEYWEGGIHCWATPKDLSVLSSPILLDTDRKVTHAGLNKISSGLHPPGTLLLSSRAPIGYLAISEVPVAINQGFIAMPPRISPSNWYMLHWCRASHEEIVSHANGSTFLEISKSNLRQIPMVVPEEKLLVAYDRLVGSLYQRIALNQRGSHTIVGQRNELLPKLISGELQPAELA